MWKVTSLYIKGEKLYTAYNAENVTADNKKQFSPYGCCVSELQARSDADKLNKEGK